MSDHQARFLRHRTFDKVVGLGPEGALASMPSDSAALHEFMAQIRSTVPELFEPDVWDDLGSGDLSTVLLIDSPDGEPIAYSPPHRFGRFWIVHRLWLKKVNSTWTLLAPYPHASSYRPHHVLRINRGKRITTLERDDCSMVAIAPPLGEIAAHGGISIREDDGIKLG